MSDKTLDRFGNILKFREERKPSGQPRFKNKNKNRNKVSEMSNKLNILELASCSL